MAPKATRLCSCGEKLRTGTALSDHLRDSPKHKNPPVKGNAVPKPVGLKEKTMAMMKPENSAPVMNTPTSHVASSATPVAEAVPSVDCLSKATVKMPEPIGTAIEENPTEKLERINANIMDSQRLQGKLSAKLEELLEFEITRELELAIKKELNLVIKRDLETEIKAEFGGDLKKLKTDMMSDLMSELKSDFKKAVKEEIKNEFRMIIAYQLSSQMKNETGTEPLDDMKSELKAELKMELMEEFKNSNKPRSNDQSSKELIEDWGLCSDGDDCVSCDHCSYDHCMGNIVVV